MENDFSDKHPCTGLKPLNHLQTLIWYFILFLDSMCHGTTDKSVTSMSVSMSYIVSGVWKLSDTLNFSDSMYSTGKK